MVVDLYCYRRVAETLKKILSIIGLLIGLTRTKLSNQLRNPSPPNPPLEREGEIYIRSPFKGEIERGLGYCLFCKLSILF
jgi:hypothetical protein